MVPKILIAIIWLVCFAVLVGLFQAYGIGAFVVLLIVYLIIKKNKKETN
tara:strand:- start:351 stop:497 length:147 start_codon:yes stop_codon:yes gene_type:complete